MIAAQASECQMRTSHTVYLTPRCILIGKHLKPHSPEAIKRETFPLMGLPNTSHRGIHSRSHRTVEPNFNWYDNLMGNSAAGQRTDNVGGDDIRREQPEASVRSSDQVLLTVQAFVVTLMIRLQIMPRIRAVCRSGQ